MQPAHSSTLLRSSAGSWPCTTTSETAKRPSCSGSAFIDVMESVQHRPRPDRTGHGAWSQLGRLESECAMRSVLVVRADELGEDRRQGLLVEHHEVVQAFAT